MASTAFAQAGLRAARSVVNHLHNAITTVQARNGGSPASVRAVVQRETVTIGDDIGISRLERLNTVTFLREELPGKCAQKQMLVSLREPVLDFKPGGYEVAEVISQDLYLTKVTLRAL